MRRLAIAAVGVAAVAIAGLAIAAATGYVNHSFRVPSCAIAPTIGAGAHVITGRPVGLGRGTIVVLRSPRSSNTVVSRIVGVGGDRIEIHDGGLFVNGRATGSRTCPRAARPASAPHRPPCPPAPISS
jgi:signal peptidase I